MKLGGVATGKDFFNRTKDLERLWQLLSKEHVVFGGPRRLGKTSVIKKLIEQASNHQYQATYIDAEGCDSAISFIEQIATKFPKQADSGFMSTLKRIKSFSLLKGGIELNDPIEQTWQQLGDQIFKGFKQSKQLILIDEFSVFLETLITRNSNDVNDLLTWLRRWRIDSNHNIKFLFTGSIGLQALLETHQLDKRMNDCHTYILKEFSTKHAIEMMQTFASRKGWSLEDENAKVICDKIGWLSPFFINLLLNEVICCAEDAAQENKEKQLQISDIGAGYNELVTNRSKFSHWNTRLKKRLDAPHYNLFTAMLSQIAKSENGLTLTQLSSRLSNHQPDVNLRNQMLEQLQVLLTDEGYLSQPNDKGETQFLSFLLKDFWKRNYV